MRRTGTDLFFWGLWHVTAFFMIAGTGYLMIAGSSLFSPIKQPQHIQLSLESKEGITYVSGTLPNQNACALVHVSTESIDASTEALTFTTSPKPFCIETGTTQVTFLSSFAGRPTTIVATLDGKPLTVTTRTL